MTGNGRSDRGHDDRLWQFFDRGIGAPSVPSNSNCSIFRRFERGIGRNRIALKVVQIAMDRALCKPNSGTRLDRGRVSGLCESVRNAQCPGLRGAGRGIDAGNRVCVRGWRDYAMTFVAAACGRVLAPRPGAGTRRSVKEVIQPQVPLRLPCYDFAPVTALAFGRLLRLRGCDTDFGRSQLPWRDGRCVQGPGTYSPWRS
jgi:hypothetical protein